MVLVGRAGASGARAGLGAVLAVAVALLAPPGLFGGAPPAEAGECEWRHHMVRVVKHVKRHGERVKVVRKRVRWSCVPVAGAAPASAPPAIGSVPPPAPVQPPITEGDLSDPHRLGAVAREFYYVPTHRTLTAGEETIELINEGQDAHNLNVEAVGGGGGNVLELPETVSRSQASATVYLPPGEYRLWCSLLEHDEKGMHTTITVVP